MLDKYTANIRKKKYFSRFKKKIDFTQKKITADSAFRNDFQEKFCLLIANSSYKCNKSWQRCEEYFNR